jgi:uncharacterized protein
VKKRLVGVIHLPPLPGSPTAWSMDRVLAQVDADARALGEVGIEEVILENFGDAPFFAEHVPPVTIAAMTACVLAARAATPSSTLGVNVLRNDAESALSIAAITGAKFIRVNVHTGARVTDQGVVQGRAAETLRLRKSLDATHVAIWADVDVKHSAPLGVRPIVDEAHDLASRGMVDAVLVTGAGTGKATDVEKVRRVKGAASRPVLVASGTTVETVAMLLAVADGVIVGSDLKTDARAGGPVDRERAARFAEAFRRAARG